jgi:hypothetical protein
MDMHQEQESCIVKTLQLICSCLCIPRDIKIYARTLGSSQISQDATVAVFKSQELITTSLHPQLILQGLGHEMRIQIKRKNVLNCALTFKLN